MDKPQTRDTPRTDTFAGSCATYAALIAKKRMDPTAKANMMEIEFCLALEHANILEVELADAKKRAAELDDTLGRVAQEFTALYEDSEKTDSVGEIYHLLRESGHLPIRMELLRLMNEEIKKTAYVSGLMRAMFFVNERKRMINGPDIPSHILDRQEELQRISERIEAAINAVLQPNQ